MERDDQLRALQAAAARAAAGQGEIVLVSGEAGSGKSRLVADLLHSLPAGTPVAAGSCDELHTPRTLGPLFDMVPALGAEFEAQVRAAELSTTAYSALLEHFRRLGSGLVIKVGDIHWADWTTIDVLKFICRRIDALPALVIITYRSEEVVAGHPALQLIGSCPSRLTSRIELEGLSRAGVARLARVFNRSPDGLFEATGGNPHLTLEMLKQPASAGSRVPPPVREAVQMRLSHLGRPAAGWLTALAAIPGVIPARGLQLIGKGMGFDLADIPFASGFLRELPDGSAAFRHELERRAVLDTISPYQRTEMAGRLLELLVADDEFGIHNVELLAELAIGSGNSRVILDFSPRAATRCMQRGAHREAAALLDNAVKFAGEAPPAVAAQLLEDWSYEALIADRLNNDTVTAVERAKVQWATAGRTEMVGCSLLLTWRIHRSLGHAEQARSAAIAAVDALESIAPTPELAIAYSIRAQRHLLDGNTRDAIRWGLRAAALARQFGDIGIRIDALVNIALSYLARGSNRGRVLIENCIEHARHHELHDLAARAYAGYCEYALTARDLPLAERLIREGEGLAADKAFECWAHILTGCEARLQLARGQLEEAKATAERLLAVPTLSVATRLPAELARAVAHARAGDPEAAERLEQALSDAARLGEPAGIVAARLGMIEHAFLGQQDDEARRQCIEILALGADALRPWESEALIVWMNRLQVPLPSLPAPAPGSAAALELAGDHEAAAKVHDALGQPFEAGIARMLAVSRDPRRLMAKAMRAFEAIDAVAASNLAQKIAAARGISDAPARRKRGPYRAARSHPLGLTRREVEILRMIVDGAGNREIAERLHRSHRTIEHHVSAILAKVEAETRTQAAMLAVSDPRILELPAE